MGREDGKNVLKCFICLESVAVTTEASQAYTYLELPALGNSEVSPNQKGHQTRAIC